MKYYKEFERSDKTFDERTIPDGFSTSIGKISMWFSELENEISSAIHKMLNIDEKIGQIITEKFYFRNKLNLMSSLFYHLTSEIRFNTDNITKRKSFQNFLKCVTSVAN